MWQLWVLVRVTLRFRGARYRVRRNLSELFHWSTGGLNPLTKQIAVSLAAQFLAVASQRLLKVSRLQLAEKLAELCMGLTLSYHGQFESGLVVNVSSAESW